LPNGVASSLPHHPIRHGISSIMVTYFCHWVGAREIESDSYTSPHSLPRQWIGSCRNKNRQPCSKYEPRFSSESYLTVVTEQVEMRREHEFGHNVPKSFRAALEAGLDVYQRGQAPRFQIFRRDHAHASQGTAFQMKSGQTRQTKALAVYGRVSRPPTLQKTQTVERKVWFLDVDPFFDNYMRVPLIGPHNRFTRE
jgi:hypothetical protein